MAVYFTANFQLGEGALVAWSKAQCAQPLLAISQSPNSVGVYTEKSSKVTSLPPDSGGTIKNIRGTNAAALCWHPIKMLLTIGWRDGAISFWNEEARRLNEDSKIHRCCVTCISWRSDGERLATADESGKVGIWQTDAHMLPIPMTQYEDPGVQVSSLAWGGTEAGTSSVYINTRVGDKGSIYCVDDAGNKSIVIKDEAAQRSLFYYPEKRQVVCISTTNVLTTYAYDEAAKAYSNLMKMKFAAGSGSDVAELKMCWTCPHTLASATSESSVVRLYNFSTEDNYVLDPGCGVSSAAAPVSCLIYSEALEALAVADENGKSTLFFYVGSPGVADSDDQGKKDELGQLWEKRVCCSVGKSPISMQFGPTPRLLSIQFPTHLTLCCREFLRNRFRGGSIALQISLEKVVIEHLEAPDSREIEFPSMQISGLDISEGHVLAWDGNLAKVAATQGQGAQMMWSFACSATSMAAHRDTVFCIGEARLEARTVTGTVKQTMSFEKDWGSPIHVDASEDYLAVVTDRQRAKIFKVGGRECKPVSPAVAIVFDGDQFGSVEAMRVNCNGTKVSFLATAKERPTRDARVFVLDIESGITSSHDFSQSSQMPEAMFWDAHEASLLAVQTSRAASRSSKHCEAPGCEVATFFATQDHGLISHDIQALPAGKGLVGIDAPHLLVFSPPSSAKADTASGNRLAVATRMGCFAGVQEISQNTKVGLLEFSCQLSIGATEEAVKAIEKIQDPAVWENMAQLCIRNGRLDVAQLCLGNMEHVRVSRALRQTENSMRLEARVGTAAVHIGMVGDAKRLLSKSERFDLLNDVLQASGNWEKAMEIAGDKDRIHLKATHYKLAKQLELNKDYRGAAQEYTSAGRHRKEVPRMLYQSGNIEELERYIKGSGDRELLRWWARYLESQGDFAGAMRHYQEAEDIVAVVRTCAFTGDLAKAEDIARETGHAGAMFYMARQYEAQGAVEEAIRCYSVAKRYRQGVRLALQYGMDQELMSLALQSEPRVMTEAADYFHARQDWDKAVQLYHKGGQPKKALELCVKGHLSDALDNIIGELDTDGDPALLSSVGSMLLQRGEYQKAARLFLRVGDVERALDMCIRYDVLITEDIAEAMSSAAPTSSTAERSTLLSRIAKVCKHQGAFSLAAKKYAEAGERLKSMKALIKARDTDKIVFFAGVCRQREAYLMAANYLRTLDWHGDPSLMKHIVSYYTKGRAHDSLVAFYEACAQIEIDEYRDYDKACQAMREALRHAEKLPSGDLLEGLSQRLEAMERFVGARRAISDAPEQAMDMCTQLLEEIPDDAQMSQACLRGGDVYALMVEYWYEKGDVKQAFELVQRMDGRNIALGPYIDRSMLEAIKQAAGVEAPYSAFGEDGDIIEEDMRPRVDDDDSEYDTD